MDYNKIKTFVVVAKEGAIGIAANKLFRTQSAITQQIQLLEEELGIALFHRRKSRIFLTKEGQELYPLYEQYLQKIDDATHVIKDNLQDLSGTIRVGILSELGDFYLIPEIIKFKKIYPNCKFIVNNMTDEKMENELIKNNIDFGFIVNFNQRKAFNISKAFNCELALVGSTKYFQ